eukprot:scaffold261260_cov18-Tisochrysis_lutea.AAC.2
MPHCQPLQHSAWCCAPVESNDEVGMKIDQGDGEVFRAALTTAWGLKSRGEQANNASSMCGCCRLEVWVCRVPGSECSLEPAAQRVTN